MNYQQNPWSNESFSQWTSVPITDATMQRQQPIFMQQPFNQQMTTAQQTPPPFYAPQTSQMVTTPQVIQPGPLPMEMSYIENILRLNRGKRAKVFMTYENNPDWPALTYEGIIEEAGRDHIVLSDPRTGKWYLLLMVNLDYVEFEEPITYEYPFDAPISLSNYQPR